VLKLDKTVFKEIRDDKEGFKQALVVVILAALIGNIWAITSSMGLLLVAVLIGAPIGWLIYGGILHIIAKLLGGKATYKGYLSVLGYAEAPTALGIIPIIGAPIGWIWGLVCAIYATRDVHELSTGKAAAVVLIPVAVITVIVALILTTHLIDTMEKYDEQYTEIMPMVDMMGTMELCQR